MEGVNYILDVLRSTLPKIQVTQTYGNLNDESNPLRIVFNNTVVLKCGKDFKIGIIQNWPAHKYYLPEEKVSYDESTFTESLNDAIINIAKIWVEININEYLYILEREDELKF